MCWPERPWEPPWPSSVAHSFDRYGLKRVRVLFISDVYFPRVNGVSTSIRTFRQDLANNGVETLLVAPRYSDEPVRSVETPMDQPDNESGLLRVASGNVPRDPEDRRMRWGALTRTLDS